MIHYPRAYALFVMLALIAAHETYFWLYISTTKVPEPEWYRSYDESLHEQLPICTGFNPETGEYGIYGSLRNCPRGWAFYSVRNGRPQEGSPGTIPLHSNCCELPFGDILTDEHVEGITGACPDDHIATGRSEIYCGSDCTMRCTKINTTKYALGPMTPGYHWIVEHRAMTGGGSSKRVLWESIPAAIRYSIGRDDRDSYDGDGCIGVPFGSVIAAKKSLNCDGVLFRQLWYKDGRPVPMFKKCDRIEGAHTTTPRCIHQGPSEEDGR